MAARTAARSLWRVACHGQFPSVPTPFGASSLSATRLPQASSLRQIAHTTVSALTSSARVQSSTLASVSRSAGWASGRALAHHARSSLPPPSPAQPFQRGLRSYARNLQFPGYGPRGGREWDGNKVLYGLIGLNVAGYVAWGVHPRFMNQQAVVSADAVGHGRVWTMLTSAFSHRDTSHILVNMVTLYFFGRNVANAFGGRQLARLYLLGALVGSAAHCAWYWHESQSARSPTTRRLLSSRGGMGASAAVNSVVLFAVCVWPWEVVYLYGLLPVPALLLGAAYLAWDLRGVLDGTASNVGHVAHLGGALTGAGLYWKLRRRGFGRWR